MNKTLLAAFFLSLSLAAAAAAENPPAISTAPVSASTAAVSAPAVSTGAVAIPAVLSVPSSKVAVSSEPVDHVEKAPLRRFVGAVQAVDVATHRLVLAGRDGKSQDFILTQRTRVSDEEGRRIEVSALKPGDHVLIRYVEGYNYIRKIDRLPPGQAGTGL